MSAAAARNRLLLTVSAFSKVLARASFVIALCHFGIT